MKKWFQVPTDGNSDEKQVKFYYMTPESLQN